MSIDEWDWPEWLTCEWIAMDKSGLWYAYSDEPHISGDTWHGLHGTCLGDPWWLNLNLPEVDWAQSKLHNPRGSDAQ